MLTFIAYAIAALLIFVAGIAWMIVISRRAQRAWADTNEVNIRGIYLDFRAPVAANNGVGPIANDPFVLGRGTSPSFGICGVCQTSYTPPTGIPTGFVSTKTEGVFILSVTATTSIGGSGVQINPGDKVYADGGTWDQPTNWLYGFTIDANSSTGCYFGNCLDTVLSGVTQQARVRLKVSG
jgi:hypothetical protein